MQKSHPQLSNTTRPAATKSSCRGRDAGHIWAQVIDLSAVLMALVSLTGMVLILFLYKRRLSGLVVLGSGAVLCILVFRFCVP